MLDKNLKEFEILKKELSDIKSSIGVFLNIAIGGSLIGSFFVFLSKGSAQSYALPTALALFIALFLVLIMYILNYKFISHNRYVGYIRLLSQEIIHKDIPNETGIKIFPDKIKNIVLFEYCMAKLQRRYKPKKKNEEELKMTKEELKKNEKKLIWDLWKEKEFEFVKKGDRIIKWDGDHNEQELEKMFSLHRLIKPESDRYSFWKGIMMLIKGVFKLDCTNSWKYPFYISYPMFLNILLFLGIAAWFFVKQVKTYSISNIYLSQFLSGYVGLMAILIFIFLYKIIKELYQIMNGSKTINAFCWKFLGYRVVALNEIGVIPYYSAAEINLVAVPGITIVA